MEFILSLFVVIVFAVLTSVVSRRFAPEVRRWVLAAFGLYTVGACAQLLYSRVVVKGGDMTYYTEWGHRLGKVIETSSEWAWREVLALFLQQPSVFDTIVEVPQSNSGSMIAVTTTLLFGLGGSEYAVHFTVAYLAFFGALATFFAFADAAPDVPWQRLFWATALFPSVAFWTAAIHKEAFCVMGIGALLTAWRGFERKRWVRLAVWGPLGVLLIVLFRAPAFPPLLLGLALYFVVDRLRDKRGPQAIVLGPAYIAGGLLLLLAGMVLLSGVSPALGLDQIGETVARQQQGWSATRGGSSIEADDLTDVSALGLLTRLPLALLNALFRPQLFDVHNVGALISAIEMTYITFLVIRSFRRHGAYGIIARLQRNPFLAMCAVITVVGCSFIGLVTLNLGSLARYRVPFLPFYGSLIAALSAPLPAVTTVSPHPPVRARLLTSRAALARRAVPRRRAG